MKQLLFFSFLLMTTQVFSQHIEDFSDETVGASSFTLGGQVFNFTGDFGIVQFANFSCGLGTAVNTYMDTGYGDGASSGVIGTISPNDPLVGFQLSTTANQCGWTGESDGNNNVLGTIRFTGTKTDNTTISEDITLNPPINDTDMESFTFSNAIWSGVDLISLELEIMSAGCDFFAFDNFSINIVTLPVELTSFYAERNENNVNLKWTTASELNNDRFEIESSYDGVEFQKIGEIKGNGTTLDIQEYSFMVENTFEEMTYYRLKQVDFDGKFEYSEIISVNSKVSNEEVGEFYPNPSHSGTVNLVYNAKQYNELAVSVFDINGKLILNRTQSVYEGENNLNFDFSVLERGIYIIKLGTEVNPIYRKLVIN